MGWMQIPDGCKQKLLQLVLWNKQAPLKEQGHNGFPQTNTVPFKISGINHGLLAIIDGCNKYCEINTVPLTQWIASSAPVK